MSISPFVRDGFSREIVTSAPLRHDRIDRLTTTPGNGVVRRRPADRLQLQQDSF
jgi:hypothetical protein